jgi:general stress protein 26
MNADLIKRAKEIIEKILYITIATSNTSGEPWNSPVYSAFDQQYTFYWISWKENQHSKNIAENKNVFLVIYDSTVPEGTGEGVYIQAKAYEVSDEKEIEKALKLIYGRINKTPRKVQEFREDYPRRIYKAVPEKIWMNDTSKINGNYIDTRVEISLI